MKKEKASSVLFFSLRIFVTFFLYIKLYRSVQMKSFYLSFVGWNIYWYKSFFIGSYKWVNRVWTFAAHNHLLKIRFLNSYSLSTKIIIWNKLYFLAQKSLKFLFFQLLINLKIRGLNWFFCVKMILKAIHILINIVNDNVLI